ncbi:MAG TPA: 3-dehydroquinate synthase, partial [Patescibacteria group bacterium]|nr:3-dehydroquinate synthase [Patescibacteria group bacterium]
MMKILTINIPTAQKQYPILIGNELIGNLTNHIDINNYSRIFIVTDNIVAPLFLKKLLQTLPEGTAAITLSSGEKEKNIVTVGKIWSAMKENNLDRKSLVINLGGGVIGDMGGFAASTYMRGIDFLQIPTTLLSQIDASVGGKTGVDFAGIKNLVGSFQQPIGVIIDTQTLKTLPKREFLSGFGEMIKHGLIADKTYFELVTSKQPQSFSQEELINLIARSCEIKKTIVEQDETENGLRKLLNFGHTIGHAIESLSLETEMPLLHGEAVAIGMVAEAKVA